MTMKKLLLILCLFSMTAHAEWKYDDEADAFRSYIDYSRIKTEGRYKSIWILLDQKSPQTDSSGKQFKSAVMKYMIDCQASKYQIVSEYDYSQQMGDGVVVSSANSQIRESDWRNSPPNSFNENYIKIACAINNNPKIPPVNNAQDNKRQRCISLGLVPNSPDFQQCMN